MRPPEFVPVPPFRSTRLREDNSSEVATANVAELQQLLNNYANPSSAIGTPVVPQRGEYYINKYLRVRSRQGIVSDFPNQFSLLKQGSELVAAYPAIIIAENQPEWERGDALTPDDDYSMVVTTDTSSRWFMDLATMGCFPVNITAGLNVEWTFQIDDDAIGGHLLSLAGGRDDVAHPYRRELYWYYSGNRIHYEIRIDGTNHTFQSPADVVTGDIIFGCLDWNGSKIRIFHSRNGADAALVDSASVSGAFTSKSYQRLLIGSGSNGQYPAYSYVDSPALFRFGSFRFGPRSFRDSDSSFPVPSGYTPTSQEHIFNARDENREGDVFRWDVREANGYTLQQRQTFGNYAADVLIKNIRVAGFEIALQAEQCVNLNIEGFNQESCHAGAVIQNNSYIGKIQDFKFAGTSLGSQARAGLVLANVSGLRQMGRIEIGGASIDMALFNSSVLGGDIFLTTPRECHLLLNRPSIVDLKQVLMNCENAGGIYPDECVSIVASASDIRLDVAINTIPDTVPPFVVEGENSGTTDRVSLTGKVEPQSTHPEIIQYSNPTIGMTIIAEDIARSDETVPISLNPEKIQSKNGSIVLGAPIFDFGPISTSSSAPVELFPKGQPLNVPDDSRLDFTVRVLAKDDAMSPNKFVKIFAFSIERRDGGDAMQVGSDEPETNLNVPVSGWDVTHVESGTTCSLQGVFSNTANTVAQGHIEITVTRLL